MKQHNYRVGKQVLVIQLVLFNPKMTFCQGCWGATCTKSQTVPDFIILKVNSNKILRTLLYKVNSSYIPCPPPFLAKDHHPNMAFEANSFCYGYYSASNIYWESSSGARSSLWKCTTLIEAFQNTLLLLNLFKCSMGPVQFWSMN